MKTADYSYCQVIGLTDRGLKRAANEDWLGERKTINGWVAVVCDGMGGHVGGATASHIAVDTILDYLSSEYFEDARIAIGKAIDQANIAIQRKASIQPELNGMGSTCVLLIVREGKVYIGHVGDSRIYLIRDHRIHQLTKDHSYVQMLVDMGEITPEQAEHHPRKNEITNALGIPQMQPATVMQNPIDPQAGDCFLLCSDGLSGMVDSKTIEHVVSQQRQMNAQERAAKLIEKAKEGGGLDNITAQLVEFGATPTSSSQKTSILKKWWLWAATAVFLCAIAALIYMLVPRTEPQLAVAISNNNAPKYNKLINLDRYLVAHHDTIMLLMIQGNGDTCNIILRDAADEYLKVKLDNVAWREPTCMPLGIAQITYDTEEGYNRGVVKLLKNKASRFSIKFEARDTIYDIEIDIAKNIEEQPKISYEKKIGPLLKKQNSQKTAPSTQTDKDNTTPPTDSSSKDNSSTAKTGDANTQNSNNTGEIKTENPNQTEATSQQTEDDAQETDESIPNGNGDSTTQANAIQNTDEQQTVQESSEATAPQKNNEQSSKKNDKGKDKKNKVK